MIPSGEFTDKSIFEFLLLFMLNLYYHIFNENVFIEFPSNNNLYNNLIFFFFSSILISFLLHLFYCWFTLISFSFFILTFSFIFLLFKKYFFSFFSLKNFLSYILNLWINLFSFFISFDSIFLFSFPVFFFNSFINSPQSHINHLYFCILSKNWVHVYLYSKII